MPTVPLDYEGLANGLLIIITGLLTFFGIRKGIKAPPATEAKEEPAGGSLRIAGALIDAKKADEIIKALDRQALSNANLEVATRENSTALSQNTDAVNQARQEIDQTQRDIQHLTLEIARAK